MRTEKLNRNNIQLVDLHNHFSIDEGKAFLVYAPLAGVCFLADASTVNDLEGHIEDKNIDESTEIGSVLGQLKNFSETDLSDRIVSDPLQYTHLSILPNLICNLSCTYCYSAKGRSKKEISIETLQTMLDFFIDKERVKSRNLSIFISGGGEPIVSWEKVRFIIEYGTKRAIEEKLNLEFLLMTNGTLISADIASMLKKFNVNVGVSFEILQEVQNAQRGYFDRVSNNIHLMLNKGIVPSFSSVITENNVDKMDEMVKVVVQDFPQIRHLNFDPAMSEVLFPTVERLESFYKKFAKRFFVAKELGRQYGITLDSNVIRKAEKLFPRYCQGKLSLTPEGKISICHTISSPLETAYSDAVYGEVNGGKVLFDKGKFSNFINKDNYLLEECSACIARWHCAGGCMMYRRNYSRSYFKVVCQFTRYMIGTIFLKRLDVNYQETCGQSIEQLIQTLK